MHTVPVETLCLSSEQTDPQKRSDTVHRNMFPIDCDYIIGDELFWEKRGSSNASSSMQQCSHLLRLHMLSKN